MPREGEWAEVTVVTHNEAVEAVSAILYDAGAQGVAIEDPEDIIRANTKPGSWDYIDESLLPKCNGEVKVKGYFPNTEEIAEMVEHIKDAVNKLGEYGLEKGKGQITVNTVFESDWANAWKQYYKPFKLGKHIVIKPSWEDYNGEPEDIIIEIDPGMAFGTGTHETTKMCVELLEKYAGPEKTVFDIGCGSGILSIAASKLGASHVTGIDIDNVAVEVSRENVKISGADNVEIVNGNLLDSISGKADIITANIIADAIIDLSGIITRYLAAGGIFISSGIIKDRSNDVRIALINSGMRIQETIEMGEWVAFVSVCGE